MHQRDVRPTLSIKLVRQFYCGTLSGIVASLCWLRVVHFFTVCSAVTIPFIKHLALLSQKNRLMVLYETDRLVTTQAVVADFNASKWSHITVLTPVYPCSEYLLFIPNYLVVFFTTCNKLIIMKTVCSTRLS